MRERHASGVRAAMARPEVVERISAGTKAGMLRWCERQLEALREAWRKSPKRIRNEFLAEIGATQAARGA